MIVQDLTKYSKGIQQYFSIKEKYKDCIMLNRIGDFYEMFFEDAEIASRELDLVLTGKSCGEDNGQKMRAPMCGVPYHAVEIYIAKLVANGHKVAICEQLSEPVPGKTVERDVVRVITPGTVVEQEMLEGSKNNYLLSVYKKGDTVAVAYADVSTGELCACKLGQNIEGEISDLVSRLTPAEIIGNEEAENFYNNLPIMRLGGINKLSPYYEWAFTKSSSYEILKQQFGENFDNVYELKNKQEVIFALGAMFTYIKETQKRDLKHIKKIGLIKNGNYMTIDLNTRRNLELVETNRERKKYGSLLWIMDRTKTSMGARYLRKMFDEPLQNAKLINARLEGVEELTKKIILRDRLGQVLADVYDIERLSSKVAYGNVTPKDLVSLKRSLYYMPQLKEELKNVSSDILKQINEDILDVSPITELIETSINEEAGNLLKDGKFIKDGFNSQLDAYRQAKDKGNEWLKQLEVKEQEATGIKGLKISYNKVFGYFIEVNRKDLDKVPMRYQRKQTVANNERYITSDLKEIEDTILGAEEKALKLEIELLQQIKQILSRYVASIQQVSRAVAKLDAILSLAVVAVKNGYCKPTVSSSKQLKIVDGRHPVVEQFMANGQFVPNDAFFDDESNRVMIITGPNMAGKSTYMRQVAVITFLAHIGSFVPAKEAHIPIVDRIFTRVGASDDLAFGQSTFMVEMSEVAHILANATDKSLVVLDEIGRGTSTFDGLSIAWSVVEYLSNHYKAKTLFATHYHELTELEGVLDGVKNYKIAVKELDDNVVFLRKIVRGGANKSFGIEVARLAGLPKNILDRAKEISLNLEAVNQKLDLNIFNDKKEQAQQNSKLALNILNELKDVDMNRVSPMTAFEILNSIVVRAKEEK
ncbi:MAG: DNA mismatch repair protein MutS [Clostridiales bacterium]|nr:DNA mismatch repair protein MutS [Clostridiales bacterium]